MEQTPVHDGYNADLLSLIPKTSKKLIEVGCSSGALAREFTKEVTASDYIGVEIDPGYARLAERYCSRVFCLDINMPATTFGLKWAIGIAGCSVIVLSICVTRGRCSSESDQVFRRQDA